MSYKVGQILSNNVSNYYTNRQIDKMDLISDIETKNDIMNSICMRDIYEKVVHRIGRNWR